jgi:dienelactone hydrolase
LFLFLRPCHLTVCELCVRAHASCLRECADQAPVSGTPSAALLLCPDVWGWNGGRIRAIADGLAGDHGYLVVVAKLLADPALDGGTDGDALPPGGEFSMDWIKNFPWPKQQPKVAAALAYLKSKGCAKIGVFGFCYGGHPACYASSTDEAVVCGVVVHPSMQLETFAFGGDCKALLSSVKCPFLLAPAGNDLPMWGEEGEFGEALKASAKGGECVWKPYPEMTHGWSCRGDVANDKVRRDVEGVMKDASGFFKQYLG